MTRPDFVNPPDRAPQKDMTGAARAKAYQQRKRQEVDEGVYFNLLYGSHRDFQRGSADPRDLVEARIGCLAKDGLDADAIRASKRYIRRFVEDVATGRQIIGTSRCR